jgi:uncharacterized protein (DUF2252 family)
MFIKDAGNDRFDYVIEALERNNKAIDEANQKAKYAKMLTSPYVFFRGTNHLFWADFTGDWRFSKFGDENTRTWLQGDAHVYNMGAFCTTNKGKIAFGLNDFDDAIVADYQYDVLRFAVSISLILGEKKIKKKGQHHLISIFANSYINTIINYKQLPTLPLITKKNTYSVLKKFLEKTERTESREKMLAKLTVTQGSSKQFIIDNVELAAASDQEKQAIIAAIKPYRNTLFNKAKAEDDKYFNIKDIAVRIGAGTGSLGAKRYFALVESAEDEYVYRILDIKQQKKPTTYFYLSPQQRREYDTNFINDAHRHAVAQLALSGSTDDYLGWLQMEDTCFSVRERSPFKKAFEITKINDISLLTKLAEQWGYILANQHRLAATTYNQEHEPFYFERRVAEKLKKREDDFVYFMARTATRYADQTVNDWNTLMRYVNSHQDLP